MFGSATAQDNREGDASAAGSAPVAGSAPGHVAAGGSLAERLEALVDLFDGVADAVLADGATGREAGELVSLLARLEKRVAAVGVVVGGRAVEMQRREDGGDRVAAEWLSEQTGCSRREAERSFALLDGFVGFGATRAAFEAGVLTRTQAGHVLDAAQADPDCEADMLGLALRAPVEDLAREAKKIVRTARNESPEERETRHHRERRLWMGSDDDGAFTGRFSTSAMHGAILAGGVELWGDALFRRDRRLGIKTKAHGRRLDAVMTMVKIALGATPWELGFELSDLPAALRPRDGYVPDHAAPGGDDGGDVDPDGQAAQGEPVEDDDADGDDGRPAGRSDPGAAPRPAGRGRSTRPARRTGRGRTGHRPGDASGDGSDNPDGRPRPTGPELEGPNDTDESTGDDGLDGYGDLPGPADPLDPTGPAYGGDPAAGNGPDGGGGGSSGDPPVAYRPRGPGAPVMHLHVDLAALRRGELRPGERCEIPGVGPVSIEAARELLSDAAIRFILKNGRDVAGVAHGSRSMTAHQKTAVVAMYHECCVAGCGSRVGLEDDHQEPWAKTGHTWAPGMHPICPEHHRRKSNRGWDFVVEPPDPITGHLRLVPPDHPEHPNQTGATPPRPPQTT